MGQYHDDLNLKLALIQSLTNAAGASLVQPESLERKVPVRADRTVSPSKFVTDPLIPGGFKAHPQTIRAMRKDLFVLGEEGFEDLESFLNCASCHETIDTQFWLHCPYCEASFPETSKS